MKKHNTMTEERYNFLMWDETEECRLTQEEIYEGWHWCPEWDGLLIHPLDKEFEFCSCKS